MRADETISYEEAKEIYDKFLTEESRALLEDKFDLKDIWDMSLRKGVIFDDEDIPVAIAGISMFNLRNVLWVVPLEGMRKKVRSFLKFMKSFDFEGEVYTFADDPKAKLIKIAGGKESGKGFWKIKE